jgi:hypothetical protein
MEAAGAAAELARAPGLDGYVLQFTTVLPRFAVALAIGALLAARPWRRLMGRPPPRPDMAQAQVLLCVAAAIVTIVIGDSLAKAFGLVGLGSFVRFRSGLKDPRDAAVLFLLIGLGMACGHGSLGVAVSGAVLGAVLLAGLDLFKVPDPPARDEPERGAAAPESAPQPPVSAADAPAPLRKVEPRV